MIRTWSRGSACLLLTLALLGQQPTPCPLPAGEDSRQPSEPTVLLEQARRLMEAGRYREAEGQLRGLLAETRKLPSLSQPAVSILNTLGLVLHRQGRYQEAYPLLVEAVATAERIPDFACSYMVDLLSNLGTNYHERGVYDASEKIYRRALALTERGCDNGPADDAEALNNLATLAFVCGHYEEAESMYQAALSGYIAVYGWPHPRTALAQENLGRVYQARGWLAEAESLYNQVLETQESVVGFHHPDVARNVDRPCGSPRPFNRSGQGRARGATRAPDRQTCPTGRANRGCRICVSGQHPAS